MYILLLFLNLFFGQYWTVPGTVKYDYIGNSFNTKDVLTGKDPSSITALDHKWVQDYTQSIYVTNSGKVFAYSNWDEGGRTVGIYQNGDVVGQFSYLIYAKGIFSNYGDIVGDNKYVYATGQISYGNWVTGGFGICIADTNGNPATGLNLAGDNSNYIVRRSTGSNPSYPRLAIDTKNKIIFITDTNNYIYAYNTNVLSQTPIDSFFIDSVQSMTTDNNGNLWVIRNKVIKKYSETGSLIKTLSIASIKTPTIIRYSKQNELMVWDDSLMQLYIIRNQDNSNFTFRKIGVPGGSNTSNGNISSSYSTYFMKSLTGMGTDASGNLYLSWGYGILGPYTTQIRSYNKNLNLNWEAHSNVFVGNITFDEYSDLTYAYSSKFKFLCDFTKPVGKKFTVIGIGDDNSGNTGNFAGQTYSRFVKGKRIIIKSQSDLYSNGLSLYVENGSLYKGQFSIYRPNTYSWFVDSLGNIWCGDCNSNKILEYKFQGYNISGNPIWDTTNSIKYPQSDSGISRRLIYYPSTDEMIITTTNSNHTVVQNNNGSIGNFMVKYNNFSSPNRNIVWSDTLIIDSIQNLGYVDRFSMWAAKDYIFTISLNNEPKVVDVYSKSDGSHIGSIIPGLEIGGNIKYENYSYAYFGLEDMKYAINVVYKKNGVYVITLENDLSARNFVYMWCPSNSCLNF